MFPVRVSGARRRRATDSGSSVSEAHPLVAEAEGAFGLTTGVDDTQVLPGARVTGISKVSAGGSNQTALLSLAAAGENLERRGRLAI